MVTPEPAELGPAVSHSAQGPFRAWVVGNHTGASGHAHGPGLTAPEEEGTPTHDVRNEARRLVTAGLSVIPIRPDGTKRPALDAWRPYQQARPDAATLASWFHHGEGLAVIGGAVSGQLEILDFDAPELFTPWCALVEEHCPGLVARLPLVQTPSDGRHVYYRCKIITGNLRLARRLDVGEAPETVIETRGEGGYAVAPPSPPTCHPLQRPYIMLPGNLAAIPMITVPERSCLLHAARAFNRYVTPQRMVSGSLGGILPRAGGHRPGDAFNAHADWSRLLGPVGGYASAGMEISRIGAGLARSALGSARARTIEGVASSMSSPPTPRPSSPTRPILLLPPMPCSSMEAISRLRPGPWPCAATASGGRGIDGYRSTPGSDRESTAMEFPWRCGVSPPALCLMYEPAVPTYDVAGGGHRFLFPDATQLEILRPQQDAMGRLWAEVVAKHGDDRVFNRARLDLLDLEARLRFHAAAARVDGNIDWGARLLFALEHVRQTLQASETDGASDAPILSPSDRVEPFPIQVLPTPLARLVTEGAAALPCPPDFLGVLMLPLLGAAIGTSRVLEVKPGWREGPRLYAAVVAEPGSKKSPALDLVATPYQRRQRTLHATYLHARARYQEALPSYERDLADWQHRRAAGDERSRAPREPVLPQVYTTDTTLEALAALLEQHPRGLVCLQDELTGWALAMDQYKGGKGADRHGCLSGMAPPSL